MAREYSISEAKEPSGELHEAFQRLMPQLSSTDPLPDVQHLERMLRSDNVTLLRARTAEGDSRIIGVLSLVIYLVPSGMKGWIEDVVVDSEMRGRGIGEALIREALEIARARGAKWVDLTSRPSRESANRLYRRIGFEQRETNVYRYRLESLNPETH